MLIVETIAKIRRAFFIQGKDYNLGTLGNTIAGAIGGAGGGQILTALLPMLAGTGGNVDIGSVIGPAAGGGVAGAILTIVVGLIKNTMAK